MRLSSRVASLQPSPTLAITARAKALKAAGEQVLPMAAGEPDFPTPEHIRRACVEALEAGHTGYVASAGIPALQKAIRERVHRDLGVGYGDDQVVVTVGAKHALYNAMQALLGPGDQAIIQAPYWVSYPAQVSLAGAEPVVLPVPDDGSAFNARALRAAVTDATRLIVLNSPSNPTGEVIGADDLDVVAQMASEHDLVVISDDIYDRLIYPGTQLVHLLQRRPDLADRTLVVNGVSKTYSMTGWRLGYALGPPALISAMRKLQDQSTSNATTFVQYASLAALASPEDSLAAMVAEFDRRRRRMVEGLNSLDGVNCRMPAGAFYAFASFARILDRRHQGQPVGSTLHLAELLLEQERVAAVPGEAFGAPGFIRFSFACGLDVIEQAIERIGRFIKSLTN